MRSSSRAATSSYLLGRDGHADLRRHRCPDVGLDAGYLDGDDERVARAVLAAIALRLVFPPAAHGVDRDDAALGEVSGVAREDVGVERASVAGVLAEVPLGRVAARRGLGLVLLERLLVYAPDQG